MKVVKIIYHFTIQAEDFIKKRAPVDSRGGGRRHAEGEGDILFFVNQLQYTAFYYIMQ